MTYDEWNNASDAKRFDAYFALAAQRDGFLAALATAEGRLAEANAAFEAEQAEKWKMAGQLAEVERLLRRYREEPKHHDCLPCPGNCDLCGLHMETDEVLK